ncbi:hypothetical protein FJY94_04960 [Candidatus Kaiserbacteria bacterium]|nr:hypothetical protein [Candidatus Kaiserbacteria bacterium]
MGIRGGWVWNLRLHLISLLAAIVSSGCETKATVDDWESRISGLVIGMLEDEDPPLNEARISGFVELARAEIRAIRAGTPDFLTDRRPLRGDLARQSALLEARLLFLEKAEVTWRFVRWMSRMRQANRLSDPESELLFELVRAEWEELRPFLNDRERAFLHEIDEMAKDGKPVTSIAERISKANVHCFRRIRLAAARANVEHSPAIDPFEQLRVIGLSVHEWNDDHKAMPSASMRLTSFDKNAMSWRVALLSTHFGRPDLFKEYRPGIAWDSPENRENLARIPRIYQTNGVGVGQTTLHFLSGAKAPFGGESPVRFADIPNGGRQTIMAVVGVPKTGVPWTKPGGLECDPENPLVSLARASEGDGFPVLMADGTVALLATNTPPDIARKLICGDSGVPADDLDRYLKPRATTTAIR